MNFINYYRCSCGAGWVGSWSSTCNDRCPQCNTETAPFRSDDFPESESGNEEHGPLTPSGRG
jgi:hypothetical protein